MRVNRRQFMSQCGTAMMLGSIGFAARGDLVATAHQVLPLPPAPHLNICTIGHLAHGKSTLTAAIMAVQASEGRSKPLSYGQITRFSGAAGMAGNYQQSIRSHALTYASSLNHYAHRDCPGHGRYTKNAIVGMHGSDAGILVVSGGRGVESQTEEHVLLARGLGVPRIIAFVNEFDLIGTDSAKLLQAEIRRVLEKHGYADDRARVVHGSALRALENPSDNAATKGVRDLIEYLDSLTASRETDSPLLFAVDRIYRRSSGAIVTGIVEQGTAEVDDTVEIAGLGAEFPAKVANIMVFDRSVRSVSAGDSASFFLKGVDAEQCRTGQLVCAPRSSALRHRFKARVFAAEGERRQSESVFSGSEAQFHVRTASFPGGVTRVDEKTSTSDGGSVIDVELMHSTRLDAGQSFIVREAGRTVGVGTVLS